MEDRDICHDFIFRSLSHYINATMHLLEQPRRLCDSFDKVQGDTKTEVDRKTQGWQTFEKAKLDFTLNVCILLIGTRQKVYSFSIIIHLGYWIDYGVFPERNWVTQCAVLYIQMKESNSVLNLFFRRYFNALLTRLWHFLFNMIFFPLPLAYLNFRALVQLPKLKTLHHRVTHGFEP